MKQTKRRKNRQRFRLGDMVRVRHVPTSHWLAMDVFVSSDGIFLELQRRDENSGRLITQLHALQDIELVAHAT